MYVKYLLYLRCVLRCERAKHPIFEYNFNIISMYRKSILLFLSVCLYVSCQQRYSDGSRFDSVEDIPQHKIVFAPVGLNNSVKGNGGFVVLKDTVFFIDFYYDYNDKKELTAFSVNSQWKKRLLTHLDSGPLELSLSNRRLVVFRRVWKTSYKEYDLDSLLINKEICSDSIFLPNADHLLRVKDIYLCEKIVDGGPHILDVYDTKGKFLGSVDPYGGFFDLIHDKEKRYILGQGYLGYNKSGNYVVFASVYMGVVSLFDVVDKGIVLKKTIQIGSEYPKDIMQGRVTPNSKVYARDICSDESNTYILYGDSRVGDKSCYILRLDENGCMDCLKSPINLLRIYATNKRIYGIADCGKRGNTLVSANLSNVLNKN